MSNRESYWRLYHAFRHLANIGIDVRGPTARPSAAAHRSIGKAIGPKPAFKMAPILRAQSAVRCMGLLDRALCVVWLSG